MKEIPLTQGKVALIDDADYEALPKYNWTTAFQNGKFFARAFVNNGNGKYQPVLLHRLILGDSCKGKQVEFINGNTLDSRRENLRACTRTAYQLDKPSKRKNSTSSYKGVFWNTISNTWCTSIMIEGTSIYLGSFHSEVKAAEAYKRARDISNRQPTSQSAIDAIKQSKPITVKTPTPPKPVKVRIPKAPTAPKPVKAKIPKPPKPAKMKLPKAPKVKIPKAKTIKVVAPLPDNPMVSKYKGVYYDKGYWVATIKLDGRWNTLGSYLFEDDAATAYDDAAIEAFGDTAILNFPINS